MTSWLRLGLFAVFLLWPVQAGAHAFSRSLSTWQLAQQSDGSVVMDVVFAAPGIAAESVPYGDPTISAQQRFAQHLSKTIFLGFDEALCSRGIVRVQRMRSGQLRAALRFQCPKLAQDQKLRVQINAFFDSDPGHIHFARFVWRGKTSEHLFSDKARRHTFSRDKNKSAEQGTGWEAFTAYIPIGVSHILSGWDHLAFLAALLLICGQLRVIFWAVTGFTLGHSLTLGLAAIGVLTADAKLIEALIGFTILLVALESAGLALGALRKFCLILAGTLAGLFLLSLFAPTALSPTAWAGLFVFTLFWGFFIEDEDHARRFAPFLSVLFGLIHGFGFASVLSEIGLPDAHLLAALAGFNIGVELGQLGLVVFFVVLAWGAKRVLAALPSGRAIWDEMPYFAASLLIGLGVYWFMSRAFLLESF